MDIQRVVLLLRCSSSWQMELPALLHPTVAMAAWRMRTLVLIRFYKAFPM